MTDSQEQPGVREPFKAPRFRLLIIGQTGVGKTSLINQAFGVDLPVAHRIPGKHNIEEEITSSHNDMFVLHDSEGFEEFHKETSCRKINDFIESRLEQSEVKDQLHAIWLCCSLSESTPFDRTHQKILAAYCELVPVVMVFTKLDVLREQTRLTVEANHPNKDENAINDLLQKEIKRKLCETYLQPLRSVTERVKIPHAVVSVNAPHGQSVQDLVKITQQLLSQTFGPLAHKSVALSVAQRVNPDNKIESSIEIALKGALESLDSEPSLDDCLESVHRNLIKIWNFAKGDKYLSKKLWLPRLKSGLRDADSNEFCRTTIAQKRENVANLMIYVMDLIFILRMIFVQTRTAEGIRPLGDALIDAVFDAYTKQQMETIHEAVNEYLNAQGDSVDSEDVAQHARELMRSSGTRFDFVVNVPTPQARTNTATSLLPKKCADQRTPLSSASGAPLPERHKDEPTPSRPAPAVVWPGTPEDARLLFSKSDDDVDDIVGIIELMAAPGWYQMRPTKCMTIKVVRTQQRFLQVPPGSCKWATCLGFRLDVGGLKPKSLKMTGTLWNDPREGVFEITALYPPPPTGDHRCYTLRHERAMTAGSQIGTGWDAVGQVTLTTFDNTYPRKEFEMEFTPLPGKKSIDSELAFVVQVAYPGERTPFTLNLQFDNGYRASSAVKCKCDGVTEIIKSVGFIPTES